MDHPKMDRRKFFSFLGVGGGAAVSLTALKAIAPQAEAIEIRRNRQYVFRLPYPLRQETREAMREVLVRAGLHNPILIDGKVEIFELEASDAPAAVVTDTQRIMLDARPVDGAATDRIAALMVRHHGN